MQNQLATSVLQLSNLVPEKFKKSKGKRVLGIFWEMKPHSRALFGEYESFNSGAALLISPSVMDFYVIEYVGDSTYCYRGEWRGNEDITWFKTEIVAGTIEEQLSHKASIDLESRLTSYYTISNLVDTLPESNPRAGYFIPMYP